MIVLLDAELLYRSEGIRVLLQTLADGPAELGPVLAHVFLAIIDNPKTREFLKLGTDLEVWLLTDKLICADLWLRRWQYLASQMPMGVEIRTLRR